MFPASMLGLESFVDTGALLEEVDQGVVVLDRERATYLFVNRAGRELARRPANELLGRSFWDLYPDVVGNPVYEAFQRVVAGGGRQRVPAFHYPSCVFEPFRRGPRTSDRRGAGLGLYVARQIVSAHGGEITVLSPDGDGTTFVVTLPRRPPVSMKP